MRLFQPPKNEKTERRGVISGVVIASPPNPAKAFRRVRRIPIANASFVARSGIASSSPLHSSFSRTASDGGNPRPRDRTSASEITGASARRTAMVTVSTTPAVASSLISRSLECRISEGRGQLAERFVRDLRAGLRHAIEPAARTSEIRRLLVFPSTLEQPGFFEAQEDGIERAGGHASGAHDVGARQFGADVVAQRVEEDAEDAETLM